MSDSQPVDRNRSHTAQAQRLLWPVSVAVFLFTVSYPANDFGTASTASDIGLGLFLVYAGIAAVTVGVVFALVLPWALHREGSGGVALALAAGGAFLGWARIYAPKGRKVSQAAFVIGLLGVLFNVVSYADVFI